MVQDVAYVDRMSDIALHDEQGSRDRPFDLRVAFDPARVDAALGELGVAPWRGPRPPLLALVAITRRDGSRLTMTADGLKGGREREALLAAAERFGMRVILLPEDA